MCGISSSSPKANRPGAAVASAMTEAAARPRALLASARNDASLPDAASSTSMAGDRAAVCVFGGVCGGTDRRVRFGEALVVWKTPHHAVHMRFTPQAARVVTTVAASVRVRSRNSSERGACVQSCGEERVPSGRRVCDAVSPAHWWGTRLQPCPIEQGNRHSQGSADGTPRGPPGGCERQFVLLLRTRRRSSAVRRRQLPMLRRRPDSCRPMRCRICCC